METIEIIFKVGTEFHQACKEYLLIKKVDELQHDINLIKSSFFGNALDFVEKASVCENENNIRFFLESAYNNFSQSVKMYADSVDRFLSASTSYAIKDGIADSMKFKGNNAISRSYNKTIDDVKNKATTSDKDKAAQSQKECEVLEMSYVGKAMCEFYLEEYSLCLKSIDDAIGVHLDPWVKIWVKMLNSSAGFFSKDRLFRSFGIKLLQIPIEECEEYLIAQRAIASEHGLSLEQLNQRNKIMMLLQRSASNGDEISLHMLQEIN